MKCDEIRICSGLDRDSHCTASVTSVSAGMARAGHGGCVYEVVAGVGALYVTAGMLPGHSVVTL